MSKRGINVVLAVAAATASTVIGVAFQAGAASAATTPSAAVPGWHVLTTVGPRHGVTSVANLVATSRTDGWSTWGGCSPCSGPNQARTFRVERWNGNAWRIIPIPTRLAKYASNSVALGASSGHDAWLFNAGTIASKPLHWNGTRWSVHAIPAWVVKGNLSGTTSLAVADFGRAGMWVISQGQKSFQPTTYLAGFFHKGRWHKVKLPGIPARSRPCRPRTSGRSRRPSTCRATRASS